MIVTNGGFELGTSVVGVPLDWVVTSSTGSDLSLFGEYQSAYETFYWGELVVNTSTWLVVPFGGSTPGYEDFKWGGSFIEEWDTGWSLSTPVADFTWSTFDDTFTSGDSTPVEDFTWSTFDDTFTSGDSTPVESFGTGW